MSFFQNPFNEEYQGYWVLGDRALHITFKCPPNVGRGDEVVRSYNNGPYDLTGNDGEGTDNDLLSISFAIDVEFENFVDLQIDIGAGAASASAVTLQEIVGNLNANSTFATYFEARIPYGKEQIEIFTRRDATKIKFYVVSTGAETILGFNKFAGVGELPTYFDRHTIVNRRSFTDGVGHIIALDPSNTVDAAIIDNAVDGKGNSLGFSSGTVRADWELLEGRAGIFQFTNQVDATTQIIYSAGAKAGDLSKMIIADGTHTWELPHTLDGTDLITPP